MPDIPLTSEPIQQVSADSDALSPEVDSAEAGAQPDEKLAVPEQELFAFAGMAPMVGTTTSVLGPLMVL